MTMRSFKCGDLVKVIAGEHVGQIGVIRAAMYAAEGAKPHIFSVFFNRNYQDVLIDASDLYSLEV